MATRPTGGGRRRRLRLQTINLDRSSILVKRNGSKKLIPANWCELLVRDVDATCDQPVTLKATNHRLLIPHPGSTIAKNSLPTSGMLFVVSDDASIASYQRRIIDRSVTMCDVHTWPVPEIKSRTNRNGEVFINTGLPLLGYATNHDQRHSFNAAMLKGHEGITWSHIQQYEAGQRRNKLGVKTACGHDCSCRFRLEKLWSFGWEMHY